MGKKRKGKGRRGEKMKENCKKGKGWKGKDERKRGRGCNEGKRV